WNASRGAKAKDYFFARYNIVATICSVSCRRFPRTPSLALSHSVKRKEHLKVDFLLWKSAIKLITNSMIGRIPLREIVCLQVEPFASRIALDGSASPNRLWYKALEGHFPCRTG